MRQNSSVAKTIISKYNKNKIINMIQKIHNKGTSRGIRIRLVTEETVAGTARKYARIDYSIKERINNERKFGLFTITMTLNEIL
jgi:hypothetical protein